MESTFTFQVDDDNTSIPWQPTMTSGRGPPPGNGIPQNSHLSFWSTSYNIIDIYKQYKCMNPDKNSCEEKWMEMEEEEEIEMEEEEDHPECVK